MAKDSADKKQEKLAKSDKKAADKKPAQKKKQANPFQKFIRYCKDLKSEIKKVVWPSKKDVKTNTVTVIAVVLIAAIVLIVLDLIFGGAIHLVVGA